MSSTDVFASAIGAALEAVLRKVSEGKKLSTEDLVVLMLGLFRELRGEVVDVRKEIAEVRNEITNMVNNIDRRIDETNKRIDALYDLLGKIYQTLIKQETTTQRQ